jgi:hypothetical protein
MHWGARASFVVEGVEAMRAFLEDRDSMATRELKARGLISTGCQPRSKFLWGRAEVYDSRRSERSFRLK